MEKPIDYGELNYNAYCASREWKSFNGDPLPQWPDVKPEIKLAWSCGATAVLAATPLLALGESRLRLRKALEALVGVDSKEDLEKMILVMKQMPGPEAEANLGAVKALLETL